MLTRRIFLRGSAIAMAGMVTVTLRLPPLAVAATVNPAAYADYAAGVSLSRRNTTLDRAIPLLERAVQANPGSPLTHAKLAEGQWMKFRVSGDARWSERAQESLRNAEQLNPDIPAVRFVAGLVTCPIVEPKTTTCRISFGRVHYTC